MTKHLRTFFVAALAVVCSLAHADAYWLWQQQRNSTDTGYVTRLLPTPPSPALVAYDPTTQLPGYLVVGTTLSITSGVLNVSATTAPKFDFSLPAARTLVASTDYQAADPTKAAIVTPSYSCTNATTVLGASACTLQVRMGASSLTCSTGTVLYTQSLTVQLGVLITQASTNPVQINLPIGAHFIICPSAGTFTTSTVEQSAG